MIHLHSIEQVKNLKNKRVLLRTDFNVPLKDGKILDDFRIRASLPTIQYLLKKDAKVIIISHLGQPEKGAGKARKQQWSLRPIRDYLMQLLGQPVGFLEDFLKKQITKQRVVLVENLRFDAGEEKNDEDFAKSLAELGEIYVNDAFGVCHRSHASVVAITKFLPSYAGLLLEEEIKNLSILLEKPQKPFVALIGGAKISTKLGVIKKLLPKLDFLLLGGGFANTVLQAKGLSVGKSLAEPVMLQEAKEILQAKGKVKIPLDVIVASGPEKIFWRRAQEVSAREVISDIGPETIKLFSAILRTAKTILWNGPVGMFEQPQFRHGSIALGGLIASRAKGKTFAVVGGGETIAALQLTGMANYIDWISTGGGAMLEFLEKGILPGIEPLI